MQLVKQDINRVLSRPFILIFMSLSVLIYCIIDFSNPLVAIILGFSTMGDGDILGTVISLLKILLTPEFILKGGFWVAVGLILLAILSSFFLSGMLYILHNTLRDSRSQRGEFIAGIKNYFMKLFLINIRVFVLWSIFIAFISVVSIPSLFVTWSWKTGKSELFFMMLLLDIVTAAVVFFSLMFFRIYTFYWYPSLYYFKNGAFLKAKKLIDEKVFDVMRKLFMFDIIFIIFEVLILYFRYIITVSGSSIIFTIILFTAKWIFLTIFSISLITYIFASFKNADPLEEAE